MKDAKTELPIWWPHKPPVYDLNKSYLENVEQGPFFDGPLPERRELLQEEWIDFLGFKLKSPIGVPAGPLLNAKWVSFAARMGFDIVTYKTIRSQTHPAHPLPNMVYVETHGQLNASRSKETLCTAARPPSQLTDLAVTNSFGIPSMAPDFLLEDIASANQSLDPGQVMIVSVVGTPRSGEDFIEDFAACAALARDGGAKIIEADLSCPNVASCEGSLFLSPQMVYDISLRIKQAIGPIPLVIKVGVIEEEALLREVMVQAAKANVEAICGINTVSMKVVDREGNPALGNRLVAGVCGGPIRGAALDFVKKAAKINTQDKLGMAIMATGGAMTPGHFEEFFQTGADVAMSAVGMLFDPYLAARYHKQQETKR